MSQKFTGNLPVIIQKQNQENAIDYTVYGDSDGSGVQTENLFDKDRISANTYINSSGNTAYGSNAFVSYKIPVFENKEYCLQNLEQKFLGGYYVAFYGEQDNVLSVIDPRNQNSVILTSPIGSKYFLLSGNRNITLMATTFTEGSTAPSTYIPFGYKIPILNTSGVTENLINPESAEKGRIDDGIVGYQSGTSALTWDNSTNRINYTTITSYRGFVTEVFDVVPNSYYTINYAPSDDTTVRIAFYNSSDEWLNKDIVYYYSQSRPYTITIPSNASKMRIAFNATNSGNHYIETPMLTKGSTPPDHYIPHRYTSDIPIYIGDSKLGKEEYADYGEQKVWKQFEISGLSEPLCGIGEYKDTLDLSTGTVSRCIKKLVLTGTEDWLMQGSTAKNYYFRLSIGAANTVLNYYALFCTHFVTARIMIATEEIGASVYNSDLLKEATLNIRPSGITTANAFKQILANEYANGTPVTVWYVLVTPTTETVTVPTGLTGVVEGYMSQSGVPTQASPIYPTANGEKQPNDTYSVFTLQPTDPPVPLPAINTYKGENTLSSTETVGNVSLEFNEATFYAGNNITQVYTNNQLYDLIDSSFYSLIANSYDSTQTYETDSYCIYNYCLYKCITAITTPEAFNPAKWQRLNVADCI